MLTPPTRPHALQPGFLRTFAPQRLTLGLFYPIEAYTGDAPTMNGHAERASEAEAAGFAALWIRDVPVRDPNFGDLGQVFDPFVYLGFLAAQTTSIALGTSGIVVPIRNPIHLAKGATSIDQLSDGRLLLGLASGDRPVEFPAFGVDVERRGEIFREYVEVMRKAQRTSFETLTWSGGTLRGADVVPKATTTEIPFLVTGSSRQSVEWIAAHAHGWINYPRPLDHQRALIAGWRASVAEHCGDTFKPFSQSLYIDLLENPEAPPQPIHLGYRLGRHHLLTLLALLRSIGVNHVMLSLKFSRRPARDVIAELAEHVVPHFPSVAGSGA